MIAIILLQLKPSPVRFRKGFMGRFDTPLATSLAAEDSQLECIALEQLQDDKNQTTLYFVLLSGAAFT